MREREIRGYIICIFIKSKDKKDEREKKGQTCIIICDWCTIISVTASFDKLRR